MSIQTERLSIAGNEMRLIQTFQLLDPLRQQRADSFYLLLQKIKYLQDGMGNDSTLQRTHKNLSRLANSFYTALAYKSKDENNGSEKRVIHEEGKEVGDGILQHFGLYKQDQPLLEVPLG